MEDLFYYKYLKYAKKLEQLQSGGFSVTILGEQKISPTVVNSITYVYCFTYRDLSGNLRKFLTNKYYKNNDNTRVHKEGRYFVDYSSPSTPPPSLQVRKFYKIEDYFDDSKWINITSNIEEASYSGSHHRVSDTTSIPQFSVTLTEQIKQINEHFVHTQKSDLEQLFNDILLKQDKQTKDLVSFDLFKLSPKMDLILPYKVIFIIYKLYDKINTKVGLNSQHTTAFNTITSNFSAIIELIPKRFVRIIDYFDETNWSGITTTEQLRSRSTPNSQLKVTDGTILPQYEGGTILSLEEKIAQINSLLHTREQKRDIDTLFTEILNKQNDKDKERDIQTLGYLRDEQSKLAFKFFLIVFRLSNIVTTKLPSFTFSTLNMNYLNELVSDANQKAADVSPEERKEDTELKFQTNCTDILNQFINHGNVDVEKGLILEYAQRCKNIIVFEKKIPKIYSRLADTQKQLYVEVIQTCLQNETLAQNRKSTLIKFLNSVAPPIGGSYGVKRIFF